MTNIFRKLISPLIFYRRVLKSLFTIVLAIVCFGCYLLLTPPGAKTALYFIADLSGYKISFNTVEGNLTHHLRMTDFRLLGPAIDIEANELDLRWQFTTLLKKDKTLQSFKAKQLKVNLRLPGLFTDNLTKPTLHDLQIALEKAIPIPLKINYVQINNALLIVNKQSHEIKALTIKQASTQLNAFEEILYYGSFGSIEAHLQQAIKIKWNLNFAPPSFFDSYFSSEWIATKGEIFLPHREIKDLENYIDIHFKTLALKTSEHHFKDLDLSLKGTPIKHQLHFKGIYQDTPIETLLAGTFEEKAWQGKINTLKMKKGKWLDKGKISGQARLDWKKENVAVLLDLQLFEKYPVNIVAKVDKKKPHRLNGTLKSHLNEIKTLSILLPAAENLHGKLDLSFDLTGTLFQPTFNGNLLLTEANLKTSAYGSRIFLHRLLLTLNESRQVKINGEGTLGSGKFTLDGTGVFDELNPTLSLALKGKTLLLSDTPEYYIIADPELTLTLEKGHPKLEGTIFVPTAEIQSLKNNNAINPSSDVVIVKKGKSQHAAAPSRTNAIPEIPSTIEIILGNNITYKGHGLSTKVKGRLKLTQAPNELPLANGKFTLYEGKYRAYGKTFEVNNGQILFTGGPIYDPILDIQAQRKVQSKTPSSFFKRSTKDSFGKASNLKEDQDIVVGVKFTGNLKSPKLDFFSSPSLSEADILSYLVVGHPQNEISDAQAELLFQAASQLAGFLSKSANAGKFDIAEQFKLDQFGLSKKPQTFATSSNSNTANKNLLEDTVFVLGKQLSDRLYLHYSVGILDSASNFGLRYSLGKNLTLEAATGSQGSSADLLLSFEGR